MPNGFSTITRRQRASFSSAEAGGAELLDDRAEQLRRDGKIEQHVAAGPVGRRSLLDRLGEATVGVGLGQVAGEMDHPASDQLPSLRVEGLRARCRGRLGDEGLDPLGQIVAELVERLRRAIDRDQHEILGQKTGPGEIVDSRHQQPLRQVAAGAEDHHGAGRRPRRPLRRGCRPAVEASVHGPALSLRHPVPDASAAARCCRPYGRDWSFRVA